MDKQTKLIFAAIIVLSIVIIFLTISFVKYGKYVSTDPINVEIEQTDLTHCVCYESSGRSFIFDGREVYNNIKEINMSLIN